MIEFILGYLVGSSRRGNGSGGVSIPIPLFIKLTMSLCTTSSAMCFLWLCFAGDTCSAGSSIISALNDPMCDHRIGFLIFCGIGAFVGPVVLALMKIFNVFSE